MNKLGRPRAILDESFIVDSYIAGISESALARQIGVSRSAIHLRLVNSGVCLRNAVEASDLLRFRTFQESEILVELFDGLLLGDASVGDNRHSEARLELSQRSDRRQWLEDVSAHFSAAGIMCKITDRGSRGLQLRTGKYTTFSKLRDRWYSDRKWVPDDVRLTPFALANWYWGDGSTNNNGYRMTFCTDAFSDDEVGLLSDRLHLLYGWHPTIRNHVGRPRLSICKKNDRIGLVGVIQRFCPPCFAYKLGIRR
jgi:hypothetical protein